jgi:hypothetical protein
LFPLHNPAISPDMTLDFETLLGLIQARKRRLGAGDGPSIRRKSRFPVAAVGFMAQVYFQA